MMRTSDWMVWRLVSHVRPNDVIVVGVGTPLALCAAVVARELIDGVRVLVGPAVDPEPHDIAETIHDPSSLPGRAAGVLSQRGVLGLIQRGDVDVQFVAPAQVDGEGRFNTVAVETPGGPRWLAGPLALPDTTLLLDRVVAYRADHSPRFLVGRVDHVTGGGLAGVVTSAADIRFGSRPPGTVAIAPGASLEEVREGCSFELGVALEGGDEPPALAAALERLDPQRMRDLEVRT